MISKFKKKTSIFFIFIFISFSVKTYSQIEEKTFFVVISSHFDYKKALSALNKINLKNLQIGITKDKSFYVVCYKVSEDFDDALRLKKLLISNNIGENIWISTEIKIIPPGANPDSKEFNLLKLNSNSKDFKSIYPLLEILADKDQAPEEKCSNVFLGLFYDISQAKELKKEFFEKTGIESIVVADENKKLYSLKFDALAENVNIDILLDAIKKDFSKYKFDICNDIYKELTEEELENEKKKEEKKIRKLRIHFGYFSPSFVSNPYSEVYFSDYELVGLNLKTQSNNEGRLLLNLRNFLPYQIAFGFNLALTFRLNTRSEIGIDFAYSSSEQYSNSIIYNLVFKTFFYNLGKFYFGIFPKIGFYNATINYGKLEAISSNSNYSNLVLIKNSAVLNPGDLVYNKLSTFGFQFNFTAEYELNNNFSFYFTPGFVYSLPAENQFVFSTKQGEFFLNSDSKGVLKNVTGNEVLNPIFNTSILGFIFKLGAIFNLQEKNHWKEIEKEENKKKESEYQKIDEN